MHFTFRSGSLNSTEPGTMCSSSWIRSTRKRMNTKLSNAVSVAPNVCVDVGIPEKDIFAVF